MGMVRIRWRRQSSNDGYRPEDMIGEPVIYAINDTFARLFDLSYQRFPDPNGSTPLTRDRLLESVRNYIDDEHMKRLNQDQERLANRLILKDRPDQARVPLQFNANHPEHPNEVFLPCMIGKRTVGEGRMPHTTYLLISYIRDF
jgi:hypothetical protein